MTIREACEELLEMLPDDLWPEMVSGPDVDDDVIEIHLGGQTWVLQIKQK
jgi:hypothetical protein